MFHRWSMSESKYTKINLNRDLADKIEQFIREYPEHGYRTLGQFVEDAVRRRAEDLHIFDLTPRFEHFNLDKENGIIRIRDKKYNIYADIYAVIRNGKPILWCEHDNSTNCEHVKYALSLDKVREIFRRKGWKLPEV